MKKKNKYKETHTADTKYGMGDYYGTGIKNPIGIPRDIMGVKYPSPKNFGKPPKTLA